jgi:hypothetical protein
MLHRYNLSNWSFIGAMNPGAKEIGDSVNATRHRSLDDQLKKLQVIHFEGIGKATDWQESGYFIFGIGKEEAVSIARRWGQVCFVYGEQKSPAALVYAWA